MYGWIWRHLPGRAHTRLLFATVLLVAAAAFLWFVAFPWLEPRVPLDRTVVRQ